MSNKKITIVLVLDASSSMDSMENEVRDGLVQTLKEARESSKEENADYTCIVVQFASDVQVLFNGPMYGKFDIDSISKQYDARGMTAMLDGIGEAFRLIPKEQDGVFINIFTDGEENCSKEYKLDNIKELLKTAKKNLWGVTFMGVSEDSIQNAVDMGVSRGNTMRFAASGQGVNHLSKIRSSSMKAYTAMASSDRGISLDSLENLIEDDDKKDKS